MAIFVAGAGALCSVIMIILALLCRGSGADQILQSTQGVGIFTYTVSNLPQVLIDGMTIGFVYAAIALGYTMVYGVLQFINFAHSEIFAIGAFCGVESLIALNGAGILAKAGTIGSFGYLGLALLIGMVAAGGMAVLVERLATGPAQLPDAGRAHLRHRRLVRPAGRHPPDREPHHRPVLPGDPDLRQLRRPVALFRIGSTVIDIQVKSVVVILAAVAMLVALNYLVRATKVGKAIRAVSQDKNTAALMGIGVNGIISLTFLVGGSLGGAAGVLYALKFTRIDPFVGFIPGIKAFAAAVLGGIGNLTGALLGGMVLGMIESFAGAYLGTYTMGAFGAEYKDMVAFLILILVIIFRPNGLLGEQVSQKA